MMCLGCGVIRELAVTQLHILNHPGAYTPTFGKSSVEFVDIYTGGWQGMCW